MTRSYAAMMLIAVSTALAAGLLCDVAGLHGLAVGAGVWAAYEVGRFTTLERRHGNP